MTLPDLPFDVRTEIRHGLRAHPVDAAQMTAAVTWLVDRAAGAAGADRARLLGLAGGYAGVLRDRPRAESLLREALDLLDPTVDVRQAIVLRIRLADVLATGGDPDAAVDLLQRLLPGSPRDDGAAAGLEDFVRQHLAKALLEAGRPAEAVRHLERALALREAGGGPDLLASTRTTLEVARRRMRHAAVARALERLDDRELLAVLAGARTVGRGIGGESAVLTVEGATVFVKRVPLTALERRPQHHRSTANLFGLPAHLQYGVGSPGFGAWRELEAHERTTGWVLAGGATAFPLLHHWRALPAPAAPVTGSSADLETTVAYWGGMPEVRDRLVAVARADAELVLFLEHLPLGDLGAWLRTELRAGRRRRSAAVAMVDATLLAPIMRMNAAGLHHFDTHLANLLTDGARVLATDFGLATADDFDLDPDERRFLDRHRRYDVALTVTKLTNELVTSLADVGDDGAASAARRNAYVRRCAAGGAPDGLPEDAAEVVARYAPVAAVVNEFTWQLFNHTRRAPFPAGEVEAALATVPLPLPTIPLPQEPATPG